MKSKSSFAKTIAVIRSCQTEEQLKVARNYAFLACQFSDENYLVYMRELKAKQLKINAGVVERDTR